MSAVVPAMEIAIASKNEEPLGGQLPVGWIVMTAHLPAFCDKLTMFSVCIASIIRAGYVGQISLTDPSWSDALGAMWTVVELSLGVVSACLPTLRPLVVRTFKSRTSTYGISRGSRLENLNGTMMLHPIATRAKGIAHDSRFVSNSRPLNEYVSTASGEGLLPEQAHLPNGVKVLRGARTVGEAITC